MIPNLKFKLGRNKSLPDAKRRELKLARYLKPGLELPVPPDSVDYTAKVTQPWGMDLNDSLGDCVLAAAAHCEMAWTANGTGLYVPPDADVLSAYEAVGGYIPGDPSTDQGTDPLSALTYWRDTGISGHKIGAWVQPDPTKQNELMTGLDLFVCLYLGMQLPDAVLPTTDGPLPQWVVPPGQESSPQWQPDPENGHMVMACKYDQSGLYVVTWGQVVLMSWAFAALFCDEAYVILSPDVLNGSGIAPSGFDLATLRSDLALVTS